MDWSLVNGHTGISQALCKDWSDRDVQTVVYQWNLEVTSPEWLLWNVSSQGGFDPPTETQRKQPIPPTASGNHDYDYDYVMIIMMLMVTIMIIMVQEGMNFIKRHIFEFSECHVFCRIRIWERNKNIASETLFTEDLHEAQSFLRQHFCRIVF